MASILPVRVRGKTYWRIVESKRVNGKPRPIPILHLGTADALLERLTSQADGKLKLKTFRHGDVAALKAVADSIGVLDIVDRHVPKAARNQSVGTTLLLAAIHRAVRPASKRKFSRWAEHTSLFRLFPGIKLNQMSSQFFWDQMNCVPVEALQAIEADLTKEVVARLGIQLDTLLYDTTNFFTFINSTNDRSTLTKRGHSKQRRNDLRQFGLGLLVSRDGQIPLCSQVYEGNCVDVKQFSPALTAARERLMQLGADIAGITIVYDKGNNSKANQALVDQANIGYVASLSPAQNAELVKVPVTDYRTIPDGPLAGTSVWRAKRSIWGAERTVILFVSEKLRKGQIRGLEQHLQQRCRRLAEWKNSLTRFPNRSPKMNVAERRIFDLLKGQFVKRVLKIDFNPRRSGGNRLKFEIDEKAREELHQEYFGKRILVTNCHDWSDEEIILAYRGQSKAEETFRQLKDHDHLAIRPQYHWTDQKVRVHVFIGLLALLLARVAERRARNHGFTKSLSQLMETLGEIRLGMILHSSGKKGGRPRCEWKLEEATPESENLLQAILDPK